MAEPPLVIFLDLTPLRNRQLFHQTLKPWLLFAVRWVLVHIALADVAAVLTLEKLTWIIQGLTGKDCFDLRRYTYTVTGLILLAGSIEVTRKFLVIGVLTILAVGLFLALNGHQANNPVDTARRRDSLMGLRNVYIIVIPLIIMRVCFVIGSSLIVYVTPWTIASPVCPLLTLAQYLDACTPRPPGPTALDRLKNALPNFRRAAHAH